MIEAWIVIRKEKHVDTKYWVCLNSEDALRIAQDITRYWKGQQASFISQYPEYVDNNLYGDIIFHFEVEESFCIVVQPQQIRGKGEHAPI